MQEMFTEKGKRYMAVTEEERKQLPDFTPVYYICNTRGIVPPDCEHEFYISGGAPRNIKGCKKCIYWEFTNEQPPEQ